MPLAVCFLHATADWILQTYSSFGFYLFFAQPNMLAHPGMKEAIGKGIHTAKTCSLAVHL